LWCSPAPVSKPNDAVPELVVFTSTSFQTK
jgi:hypothetical protein